MTRRTAGQLSHDVVTGVRVAFRFGVVFSLLAIVYWLAAGAAAFRAAMHMSLAALLSVYAVTVMVVGVLSGLARPILLTIWGSALIGAAGGFVLGAGWSVAWQRDAGLSDFAPVVVLITTIFGCGWGLALRAGVRNRSARYLDARSS